MGLVEEPERVALSTEPVGVVGQFGDGHPLVLADHVVVNDPSGHLPDGLAVHGASAELVEEAAEGQAGDAAFADQIPILVVGGRSGRAAQAGGLQRE